MARSFAAWVDEEPDFERVAPHPFSVVCFRACPGGLDEDGLDRLNMELMESVNAAGDIYLSHTKLRGKVALRVAIGNLGTTGGDVDRCRELLKEGLACLSTG